MGTPSRFKNLSGSSPQGTPGSMPKLPDFPQSKYRGLRALARNLLRTAPKGFSLQATDLIHVAVLKALAHADRQELSPEKFFSIVAVALKQEFLDHLRRRKAARHGGRHVREDVDSVDAPDKRTGLDRLESLLRELEEADPRKAKVVDLHYFGQLKVEHVAATLQVSKRTVERDLRASLAWLAQQLSA